MPTQQNLTCVFLCGYETLSGNRGSPYAKNVSISQIEGPSLPLNGGGGLGGNVVDHTVDALDLVDDARGYFGEQILWQMDKIGGHAIHRVHTTKRRHIFIRALVTHHTHRFDGKQNNQRLPDF